jgi:hypothetical protein
MKSSQCFGSRSTQKAVFSTCDPGVLKGIRLLAVMFIDSKAIEDDYGYRRPITDREESKCHNKKLVTYERKNKKKTRGREKK